MFLWMIISVFQQRISCHNKLFLFARKEISETSLTKKASKRYSRDETNLVSCAQGYLWKAAVTCNNLIVSAKINLYTVEGDKNNIKFLLILTLYAMETGSDVLWACHNKILKTLNTFNKKLE